MEMFERFPEELFGHCGGTISIGGGQSVATGRSRAANGGDRTRVQTQRVTNIIETDGVSELCKKQTDHMTPRGEAAGQQIHAGLSGQLGNQMRRNQISELAEDGELGAGWRAAIVFFHPCLVAGRIPPANSFFLQPMGWLWLIAIDGPQYNADTMPTQQPTENQKLTITPCAAKMARSSIASSQRSRRNR